VLGGNADAFNAKSYLIDDILEAAEMVPMWEPPTAKIQTWRKMSDDDKDEARDEISKFAYDLALQLKQWYELL